MISILIITYGRETELFETLTCINKYSLRERVELLLLNNNVIDNLREKVFEVVNNKNISLQYFHTGENLGVARGRNFLIEHSRGDVLITLDDDLEIDDISDLVIKVKRYFSENDSIGAIAFNIVNFYSRKPLRHEQPHGNKNKVDFSKNFLTYYFIGAGHAIKKEVYDIAGLYPLDLGLYGGEERDLSFRILENNYDILYASDIVIYHKVSPDGRMSRKEENYFRYRNQLIVLNRYMPILYRMTSNIIWSMFYLLVKKGSIKHVLQVFNELIFLEKRTVNKNTISKIKKLRGRFIF